MKKLRRNDNNYNKGHGKLGAEVKHLQAISLIEELDRRTKRGNRGDESERKQALNPKRLLCFSNKIKTDQYDMGEAYDRKNSGKSRDRHNGEISELCNELCRDYYEIRKKLRNRPIILNNTAIAGSVSTASSSIDAPLRQFDDDKADRKQPKKQMHYSNENRELHRRQRSLLDDKSELKSKIMSTSIFKIQRSRSKKSKGRKSQSNRPSIDKTQSHLSMSNTYNMGNSIIHKSKSNRSKTKSHRSFNLKSKGNKSDRGWDTTPEISMSESTQHSIPISVIERRIRSGLQPDISMISTLSSSSYTTCDDSSVILSPRGANDGVIHKTNNNTNMGLMCVPTGCSSRQQISMHQMSRNPAGIIPSHLGTISEGDDYTSSVASSSSSYSSYSSSSYYSSFSDSSYSESESDYYDEVYKYFLVNPLTPPKTTKVETNTKLKKPMNSHRGWRKAANNSIVENRDDY